MSLKVTALKSRYGARKSMRGRSTLPRALY
jgi:hypothetical protein